MPLPTLPSTKLAVTSSAPLLPYEEVYHPARCIRCRCELAPGVHGWLRGPYDQVNHKTTLLPCPVCSGQAQSEVARMQQNALVARLFNGAHLPYGSRNWRLDTYPQDADPDAFSLVRHFLKRWRDGDEEGKHGLFLAGDTGRCKTSLAISALKEVMEAGSVGLFVSAPDLLKKIQATYNRDSAVSESDLLNTLYTVHWLVLDDLGVEKPSPFVIQEFYLLIEKRRMAGLWTIITSNLSTAQLARHWRQKDLPAGEFDPAVRVVERIKEYCDGCAVQGRNQRQGVKA